MGGQEVETEEPVTSKQILPIYRKIKSKDPNEITELREPQERVSRKIVRAKGNGGQKEKTRLSKLTEQSSYELTETEPGCTGPPYVSTRSSVYILCVSV